MLNPCKLAAIIYVHGFHRKVLAAAFMEAMMLKWSIGLFIAITCCLFIAITSMLKWVCSVYQLVPKQELSTAC